MHGLVLAGGEGSRLAAEGIAMPKPLVPVAGRPIILRLLETLDGLGCASLTAMVREEFREVPRLLAGHAFEHPFTIRTCRTPTSAHTLVAGLDAVPPGPVFCSMVDTIMLPSDWRAAFRATGDWLSGQADAVLVVTPFVQDESPLYVRCTGEGFVREVSDRPVAGGLVTGGVYGFGEVARRHAAAAVSEGVQRMRGVLRRLVEDGARVGAVEVARIVDLDHADDLRLADQWLGGAGA
ncbi:MAG TPA: NTP transferase domain-containing protein [Gemmatimonadales bacterium]|nr:NTP transferase domain-containing protein [Gemmatimonadales bacterium]